MAPPAGIESYRCCPARDAARFLSLTIRDVPLSVDEARELREKPGQLDSMLEAWLDSPEHDSRIMRYFNDQFGAAPLFVAPLQFFLYMDEQGIHYLADKGPCDPADAVTIDHAWWLRNAETIRVCPGVLPTNLVYLDDAGIGFCVQAGPRGLGHPQCGCGPDLAVCYPPESYQTIESDLRFEFARRALNAYRSEQSWLELLGGDRFYGNALMYKHYMDQQGLFRLKAPAAADLEQLRQLPLREDASAPWPVTGRVARAGLATMPAFLRQYNNFRTRINILTRRLLCQEVDGSLNTDGIDFFVNSSLEDAEVSHGSKAECSVCHYPMDNMGTTIMNWDTNGYYKYYETAGMQNESGHVFGETGSGPAFLMRGIIERGPGFHSCMAKTVWEDFSGFAWDSLPATLRTDLTESATAGPAALIRRVLLAEELKALYSTGFIGGASTVRGDFHTEINPVLQTSCSGSACHDRSTVLGPEYGFVDDEAVFSGASVDRILTGSMPPPGSGRTLSDADRARLVEWLRAGQE